MNLNGLIGAVNFNKLPILSWHIYQDWTFQINVSQEKSLKKIFTVVMKVPKVHTPVHEVHIQVAQHLNVHPYCHEKISQRIAKGNFQNIQQIFSVGF